MKRIAVISLGWSLAKPPEEQEKDKLKVAELLRRIKRARKFNPARNWCPLNLEVDSPEFNLVFEAIQQDPEIGGLVRIEHQYTEEELESAELLIWGPTNQAIGNDYYDISSRDEAGIGSYLRRCPACGAGLEQIRGLMVDKRLMRGKDISLTYLDEVILSERVAQLLREAGLTGFELRPVHHYKKPYKGEPTLYQLVATNVLPPMASPPTEFERVLECAVCGRGSQYLKHTHWWGKIQYYEDTEVYYPRSVLEVAKDFNHTAEYFGELRPSHPMVIITQRVYRLLREHKVRNWAAVPVYLVE